MPLFNRSARPRGHGVPYGQPRRRTAFLTGTLLLALLATGAAQATSVQLAWDPVPDASVAVYQVHYGTSSGQYKAYAESATTSATLQGLQPGQTYFIAVRACDAAKATCSGFSNEVSTKIPSTAPVANFVASKTSGTAPLSVMFTDKSSGSISSRQWVFGDGATASGASLVTHTYTQPGSYSVKLTVTGPGGADTKVSATPIVVQATITGGTTEPVNGSTGNQSTESSTLPSPGKSLIEAGEIAIDHQWRRVDFHGSFTDPVVIVKPPSGLGADPAVVRIDGVDGQGFMVRIQEWDYDDGNHLLETAGYLVVERGRHQLPDGSWLAADLVQTDSTGQFAQVTYAAPFSTAPVVFAGVQTFNEADAVTTRLRNVDPVGFELTLQEQDANKPQHATETIGFIAWEPSAGMIDGYRYAIGRTGNKVTHQAHEIGYAPAFVTPPVFLADLQTANGMDAASLRWLDKGIDAVDTWVEEEQSADAETEHTAETVGYLVIEPLSSDLGLGQAPPGPVVETGELTLDHSWRRVNFKQPFSDPVVIVKPPEGIGGDAAVVRVDDVDSTGFLVRLQEWDYDDGYHGLEGASYLVVERGLHQLADGAWIEAGRLQTDLTGSFTKVALNAPFAKIPVVFAATATVNETDAVTTRLRNIGKTGFELSLQEQEAYAQLHAAETVNFVAWEPSTGTIDGRRYEVGRTADAVTHNAYSITYKTAFDAPPAFLADMQSTDGGDPANLRWQNKDAESVEIWVDEEQSADAEINHTSETVGYLLIED